MIVRGRPGSTVSFPGFSGFWGPSSRPPESPHLPTSVTVEGVTVDGKVGLFVWSCLRRDSYRDSVPTWVTGAGGNGKEGRESLRTGVGHEGEADDVSAGVTHRPGRVKVRTLPWGPRLSPFPETRRAPRTHCRAQESRHGGRFSLGREVCVTVPRGPDPWTQGGRHPGSCRRGVVRVRSVTSRVPDNDPSVGRGLFLPHWPSG